MPPAGLWRRFEGGSSGAKVTHLSSRRFFFKGSRTWLLVFLHGFLHQHRVALAPLKSGTLNFTATYHYGSDLG